MVAWLRAWAESERTPGESCLDVARNEYARGIEEAANEVEERLT